MALWDRDELAREEQRLREEEARRKALEAFRAQEQRSSWDVPSWTPPKTVVTPRVGMDDLALTRVDTGAPALDVTSTLPDTVTAPVIQRRDSGLPPVTLQPRPLAEELQQSPQRRSYSGWGGLSSILEAAQDREPTPNVPLSRLTSDVDMTGDTTMQRRGFVGAPQLPQLVEPWQPPDWLKQGAGAVQQGAQQVGDWLGANINQYEEDTNFITPTVDQTRWGYNFPLQYGIGVGTALGNTATPAYWQAQFEREQENARNLSPQQGFERGLQAPGWAQGVGQSLGLTPGQTNLGYAALTGGIGAGAGGLWGAIDEYAPYGVAAVNAAFDPVRMAFSTPADELGQILLGRSDAPRGKLLPPGAPLASAYQAFQETGAKSLVETLAEMGLAPRRPAMTGANQYYPDAYFAGEYARDMQGWRNAQAFFNNLPADQQADYLLPWAMGISGGQAVWKATQDLATREQQAQAFDAQAAVAASQGDALKAAQYGQQANQLRQMRPIDVVEQYMDISAELGVGIFLDPTLLLSPGVLGKTAAQVAGWQKDAGRLFNLTADAAQSNIAKGAEAARPILEAVAQGLQAEPDQLRKLDPRTWFRLTPTSRANQDADWLISSIYDFVIGLNKITLKEDARTILYAAQNNPMLLAQGVPVASPTLRAQGGILKVAPGLVGNAEIAQRYPVLQMLPPDWVSKLNALQGEGAFNPAALKAELDTLFYNAAQSYHGLGVIAGAPVGTADIRLKALPDGTAVVEYLNKAKDILSTSSPMAMGEALRQVNVIREAAKGKSIYALVGSIPQGLASFQRSIMADQYLALSPRNWWRNAGGAIANAMGIDSYSWLSVDNILKEWGQDFAGIAPGERGLAAQTGYVRGAQEGINQPSSGFIGWLGEMMTKYGGGESAPIGKTGQVVSGTMEKMFDIPYGKTEVRAGKYSIGIGEEANRLKTGFEGWRKTKYALLTGSADDMIDRISKLPAPPPPEWMDGLRNIYIEYGQKGGKQELFRAVNNYIHGDVSNVVTLKALGIDPNLITADGWRWFNDNILAPIDSLSHEQYVQHVTQLIQDESQGLWKALTTYPPERGVYAWSDVQNPVEQGALRKALERDARLGRMDPAQTQAQIDQVIESIIQGEGTTWEAFRQDLASMLQGATPEQAKQMWAAALDYWGDIYAGKQNTRRVVDAAGGRAVAEQTDAAWRAKWQANIQYWGAYGKQLEASAQEYRTALAGVMAGKPYSPKGSPWDGIAAWMQYDPNELAAARSIPLGSPSLEAQWDWQRVMAANRGYVDHSVAYLFDAFRRYPTEASFDILTHAMREIDEIGGKVATWAAEQRALIPTGSLSKARYHAISNAAWNQGFDDMVASNQAYARALTATAIMEQAGDGVKWADEFAGGEFRLWYPNKDGTWTAQRVDDGARVQFSTPGSGSALPEVPQSALDAYMQTVHGEEAVDEVMADVARVVGAPEDYNMGWGGFTPAGRVQGPRPAPVGWPAEVPYEPGAEVLPVAGPPASTQVMPGSLEAPYTAQRLVSQGAPPGRLVTPETSRDAVRVVARDLWERSDAAGREAGLSSHFRENTIGAQALSWEQLPRDFQDDFADNLLRELQGQPTTSARPYERVTPATTPSVPSNVTFAAPGARTFTEETVSPAAVPPVVPSTEQVVQPAAVEAIEGTAPIALTKKELVAEYGDTLRAQGLTDKQISRMSKPELVAAVNKPPVEVATPAPSAARVEAQAVEGSGAWNTPVQHAGKNITLREVYDWFVNHMGGEAGVGVGKRTLDDLTVEMDATASVSGLMGGDAAGRLQALENAGIVQRVRINDSTVAFLWQDGDVHHQLRLVTRKGNKSPTGIGYQRIDETAPARAASQRAVSPTAPVFGSGAAQPPPKVATQDMFRATGEDLPIVTGGAYGKPSAGAFAPPEITGKQGTLVDLRPQMGQGRVNPNDMTKAQLIEQYGDSLRAEGITESQISKFSKQELADRINNPVLDRTQVVKDGLRGGGPMSQAEAKEVVRQLGDEWDRVASADLGLKGIADYTFGYTRGQPGRVNLNLNAGEVKQFEDLYGRTIAGRPITSLQDVENLFTDYNNALQASKSARVTDANANLFEKMSSSEIVNAVADDLKAGGFDDAQLADLAARPRNEVVDYLANFFYPDETGPAWRTYDMKVPSFLDLDPNDKRSLYEVLRDNIFRSRKTGGLKSDEAGDVTRGLISDLDSAKQQLLAQEPLLRKGNIQNTLTPAQRLAVADVVRPYISTGYDRTVAESMFVAQKASDWAMLNMRTGNRYIDQMLRLAVPFHYFVSRMPSRLAMLAVNNPAMINMYWEVQQEIDRYNKTQQTPVRMTGTIPVTKNLQVGNPLAYIIPGAAMFSPNPFLDPDNAAGPVEEKLNRVLQWNPSGFLPVVQYGIAASMDAWEPLPNGKKRTDDFELGDYVPGIRNLGYAQQAVTGNVGSQNPWLRYGDQYDMYRAQRTAGAIGIEQGLDARDPTVAFANQIIENRYQGKPDNFNVDKRYLADALVLADQAIREAGKERLITTGGSLGTGVPWYPYREGEQQGREYNREYAGLGYGSENLYGSKAAKEQYLAQSPGITGWWTKGEPMPGLAGSLTVAYNERARLYEQRKEAENNAIDALRARNPNAPVSDINTAKETAREPFDAKIEALDTRINDLKERQGALSPGDTPVRDPRRGMNPQEREAAYVQGIISGSWDLPGAPVRPDRNAVSKEEWQAYGKAYAEWQQTKQEPYVLHALTTGPVNDYQRSQRGSGKVYTEQQARELFWQAQNANRQPWERMRREQSDRQFDQYAVESAQNLANAKQRISGGDRLLQQYLDTPAGDARTALRDKDWRYSAVTMAAYNPDVYDQMVAQFGKATVNNYYQGRGKGPDWPGDNATEEQLQAYYAARDQYNDQYPHQNEINLWLNGRYTWPEQNSSQAPGQYDRGTDYTKAVEIFGPDIFDIERDATQASLDGRYVEWLKANRADYERLTGYREWQKAAGGEPTGMGQLPTARWGVNPAMQSMTPVPPDMLGGQRPAELPTGATIPQGWGGISGMGREPQQTFLPIVGGKGGGQSPVGPADVNPPPQAGVNAAPEVDRTVREWALQSEKYAASDAKVGGMAEWSLNWDEYQALGEDWAGKKAYMLAHPEFAAYYKDRYGNAWWEEAGGGSGFAGGGRAYYGGGGGYSGGDVVYEGGVDTYVNPQYINPSLWKGPMRQGWRPPTNNAWQWLQSAQMIGPDPIRKWQPPRWSG